MSTLDIIILLPLVWGAYKGYSKGLLIELSNIAALIIGVILGFKLMDQAMQLLTQWLGDLGRALPFIAFISVFVLVIIGVSAIGKIIKRVLDFTLIGNLDDAAGALLGILKWGFALSLVFWLLGKSSYSLPENVTSDSAIYPYLVVYSPQVIDAISGYIPYTSDLIENITNLFD